MRQGSGETKAGKDGSAGQINDDGGDDGESGPGELGLGGKNSDQ